MVLIGEPPPLESSSKGLQDCREAILALTDQLEQSLHGRGSDGAGEEARLRRAALAAAAPAELRDLAAALHHLWLSLIRTPQAVRKHLRHPAAGVLGELRAQLNNPGAEREGVAHRSDASNADGLASQPLSLQDRSLLRVSKELLAELQNTVERFDGTPQPTDNTTRQKDSGINHHLEDDAIAAAQVVLTMVCGCLLYTSPSPRDATLSRMPSSA